MLDNLVTEHAANLAKVHKAIEDSTSSCLQTTEKVDKLISETNMFISEIHTVAAKNVAQANYAIVNLNASL